MKTALKIPTTPEETINKLGLTVESRFIPFSQSRNKSEKSPSLNWAVTVMRNGRGIVTTDYMAGSAHSPSYKQRQSIYDANRIATECEKGFACAHNSEFTIDRNRPIAPKAIDVIYSLVIDSDVIGYGSFEDWAGSLGYDTDSRKMELTYRACLEIALKLRKGFTGAEFEALRESFGGY